MLLHAILTSPDAPEALVSAIGDDRALAPGQLGSVVAHPNLPDSHPLTHAGSPAVPGDQDLTFALDECGVPDRRRQVLLGLTKGFYLRPYLERTRTPRRDVFEAAARLAQPMLAEIIGYHPAAPSDLAEVALLLLDERYPHRTDERLVASALRHPSAHARLAETSTSQMMRSQLAALRSTPDPYSAHLDALIASSRGPGEWQIAVESTHEARVARAALAACSSNLNVLRTIAEDNLLPAELRVAAVKRALPRAPSGGSAWRAVTFELLLHAEQDDALMHAVLQAPDSGNLAYIPSASADVLEQTWAALAGRPGSGPGQHPQDDHSHLVEMSAQYLAIHPNTPPLCRASVLQYLEQGVQEARGQDLAGRCRVLAAMSAGVVASPSTKALDLPVAVLEQLGGGRFGLVATMLRRELAPHLESLSNPSVAKAFVTLRATFPGTGRQLLTTAAAIGA